MNFCSDGGGRSGVYLAIDANMELAEEEDAFDVFGYLKKLRQSRRGLIESLVHKYVYSYIIAVLVEREIQKLSSSIFNL